MEFAINYQRTVDGSNYTIAKGVGVIENGKISISDYKITHAENGRVIESYATQENHRDRDKNGIADPQEVTITCKNGQTRIVWNPSGTIDVYGMNVCREDNTNAYDQHLANIQQRILDAAKQSKE